MKTMMKETPNEMINTNSRRNNKMKKFKKIFKNQKGLTLIELLAVIVILGIVAAIAVPSIGNIIANSKDKAILAEASNIISGAKMAVAENKCGDADATSRLITCDNTKLKVYVEGVSLASGDIVTKNIDTGEWTITYTELGNVKGTDYKTGITTNKISEEQLNTNLTK